MCDQSRAGAFVILEWASKLYIDTILIENVREFRDWGPLGANGRPLKARKGEAFNAFIDGLRSLGYTVEWRILNAANYGTPQTRIRLFIQAKRRGKITWPLPLHSRHADMLAPRPWRGADRHVIDWSLPIQSIAGRKRPLKPNTIARINAGLIEHGSPVIIQLTHGGRAHCASQPLPTITCANRGELGVAYLLPQHGGGKLRPATQPAPTVATSGAIGLVVEYYGTGGTVPVSQPLPTVTCTDRFGLVTADDRDICFRMLQPHELARAQGFPSDYFSIGNKREQVKQIGNAVPVELAEAIVLAALSEESDVSRFYKEEAVA